MSSNHYEDYTGDILSLSDVSPEEFATHQAARDSKWRSVAVGSLSSSVHEFQRFEGKMPQSKDLTPPKLNKDNEIRSWTPLTIEIMKQRSNDDEVVVREAPFLLMKTHFECHKYHIDSIIDTIEQVLSENIENAYEFIASECTWRAVARQGAQRCKFEVSVYKGVPSGYIIEGHKLSSGDGVIFRTIYDEIRNKFSNEADAFDTQDISFVAAAAAPLPIMESHFTDDEIKTTISTILQLSKDRTAESMEEAAHMLYDISMYDGLQQYLCTPAVMDFLTAVLSEDDDLFDNAKNCAVLTMANISESIVGQAAVVDAGSVPTIMKLACNGSYGTIEMRRESARILANVATKLSSRVAAAMSVAELEAWANSVDDIEDDRLRMHAERAKTMLLAV